MSCKNTRRLGFPGCYRHVVKGKDVNIKPMVIPQAPLKISMEHEAAMKPLKEDFCFGNGMGRVSMCFFWSFGSHTSIPYLFNRWVLSCFMCKLDIFRELFRQGVSWISWMLWECSWAFQLKVKNKNGRCAPQGSEKEQRLVFLKVE